MPVWRLAVLCAMISACTNATAPSGGSGGSGGGGGGVGSTPVDSPSFALDIQPIFNVSCNNSSCHGTSPARANAYLDLRPGKSYGMLVNVMGNQEAIVRVIPGDAAGSYLIIKLEGRQRVGSRMPKGAKALSTTTIQNIKNWINQGAANN
jgi:hypothetical protein